MVGAPKDNKNAQKENSNRIVFCVRVPAKLVEFIREESKSLEISQSDFIILVLKIYEQNKRSVHIAEN